MVPDLSRYDWIIVNSSAGKDSQASLDKVVEVADHQVFPRSRIVVAHADLGRVEWPGTLELAREHAAHYGLRFEVETRPQGDLLAHAEERGMWPSSKQRYCTSDHKRGQITRLFTRLTNETRDRRRGCTGGRVGDPERDPLPHGAGGVEPGNQRHRPRVPKVRFLSVFGFRAEESPARRKKKPFSIDERLTNRLRHVDVWLPIHHWSTRDVWHRIHQAGTRPHWAYARGMTRLSCRFCIFAPRSQLIVAARQPENKELLEEYVQLEVKIGHRFKHKESIAEVAAAAARGETGQEDGPDEGCWNM